MVESYTPKPLEERKSHRLTPLNYLAEQFVPKWILTGAGVVAGWFIGGAIGGATHATNGRILGHNIGALSGGVLLGFYNWRKRAASEMGVAAVADQMRELLPMAMTNDEVKKEIAGTREMIAYEQRQNTRLKALAEAGPKSAVEHAGAEASASAAR
jgi:hypothetical protein